MRVLLLNHYYWPDVSANAQYGTQLAEDLVEAGMEVHAIASKGDYLGARKERLKKYEMHQGVHIHRISVTNLGKRTALRRVIDAASFHLMSFVVALRIPRPDIIITQTAPLLIVPAASFTAFTRRAKLVVWCQDVWPDIAFALGLFRKKSYSGRLFRSSSYRSMRSADAVAAIGRCMHDYLTDGVNIAEDRLVMHPNWGDSKALSAIPRAENGLLNELGLQDKCIVMYSGNMGWAHPFESIMESVNNLRDDHRIHFLFIGDGQRRPYIEDYIATHHLENITLLPYQPYEELSTSLSAGDVHLISLDPRLDGLIVPSKLYAAMAVRRPVLYLGSTRGEIARVILETDCGKVLPHDQPEKLTEAIQELVVKRAEWEQKGMAGWCRFEHEYTREAGTGRYVQLLRKLAE